MTAGTQDIVAMEEKILAIVKGFRQGNLENTIHHQKIC
jgi:hypothetical protein